MNFVLKNRVVITIDGLAGSGKTTLAKHLAARIKFKHFNSGIVYRAAAAAAFDANIPLNKEGELVSFLASNPLSIIEKDEQMVVLSNNRQLQSDLFSPDNSERASILSRHAKVREALISLQRNAFGAVPIVAEGRDMGTVVFPDADRKFFVQADEKVRIDRRLRELLLKGIADVDVAKEIIERDKRDLTRAVAPAVPATDAIIINNSIDPIDVVVERMMKSLEGIL